MSLSKIQTELKAPKNQFNKFGNYKYRALEDITEALKPLLEKYKAFFTINHEPVVIGGFIYDKATAEIVFEGGEKYSTVAYAREPENIKGMSSMQVTGATQSYSGKYASNGLFALDDTKDADSMDNSKENRPTASKATSEDKKRVWGEFVEICNGHEVDAMDFIGSQVDTADKNAVHNAVNKWLKNHQLLTDQLLVFKNG